MPLSISTRHSPTDPQSSPLNDTDAIGRFWQKEIKQRSSNKSKKKKRLSRFIQKKKKKNAKNAKNRCDLK